MLLQKPFKSWPAGAVLCALALSLAFDAADAAQRNRKKPPARTRPAEARPVARMIGAPITLVTRNGDRITGTLLDVTPFSVKIRSGNLESFHALDTLASITFGPNPVDTGRSPAANATVSPEFARANQAVITSFRSLVDETRSGIDYTEYGRRLTELRRTADRFFARYGSTENPAEARVVASLAAALTDFSWARTIWTLGFGRSGDGSVSEGDSPTIGDALAMYPDLRTAAANGAKLSVDKLVSGLWRRAGEKVDRTSTMLTSSR